MPTFLAHYRDVTPQFSATTHVRTKASVRRLTRDAIALGPSYGVGESWSSGSTGSELPALPVEYFRICPGPKNT